MKKRIIFLLVANAVLYLAVSFALWDLLWIRNVPQYTMDDRVSGLIVYVCLLYFMEYFYFNNQ